MCTNCLQDSTVLFDPQNVPDITRLPRKTEVHSVLVCIQTHVHIRGIDVVCAMSIGNREYNPVVIIYQGQDNHINFFDLATANELHLNALMM